MVGVITNTTSVWPSDNSSIGTVGEDRQIAEQRDLVDRALLDAAQSPPMTIDSPLL